MPIPQFTTIEGIEIDLVENYKYLGAVFDNRLCFQTNTDAISKKVQQRSKEARPCWLELTIP